MGFPILVRWHLYIESGPWPCCNYFRSCQCSFPPMFVTVKKMVLNKRICHHFLSNTLFTLNIAITALCVMIKAFLEHFLLGCRYRLTSPLLKPEYCGITRSIKWLLMHSTRKKFNQQRHRSVATRNITRITLIFIRLKKYTYCKHKQLVQNTSLALHKN